MGDAKYMKIMYLLFSFTIGGAERLVVDICNENAKRNNVVFLYIINDLYDKELLKTLDSSVVVICKNRVVGSNGKVFELLDICRFCRKNKIDIVHCNAFNTPELLGVTKFFCKNIRIVHTIHGVNQFRGISKFRILYRNFVCDSIIAISESVKNDIIAAGIKKEKISVVYNAINLEKFTRINTVRKKRLSGQIVIGNVARIDYHNKGQDILIDAVSALKDYYDINCLFAGGVDEKHKGELDELRERAEKAVAGTKSEIIFMGNINDIPNFLEKIDIFVLPSRHEGFGISLVEAMKMNIPCIASDLNGPKEIIGDNERGILFKTGKVTDLVAKIIMVIDNYAECVERSDRAVKYIDANFDITKMADRLEQIYRGD